MFKFTNGDLVRDNVTKFEGVVTMRTEFANGCIRYGVQSTKLDDKGLPTDSVPFDEAQLVLVKSRHVLPEKTAVEVERERQNQPAVRTGGPRSNPTASRPKGVSR
jgi:hypothetical protein